MTSPIDNTTEQNERIIRSLLVEEANRVLLRNAHLIACKFQVCSESGAFSVWAHVKDRNGVDHTAFAESIAAALAKATETIPTPHQLAEQKRTRAAELLAEAATLEQAANA